MTLSESLQKDTTMFIEHNSKRIYWDCENQQWLISKRIRKYDRKLLIILRTKSEDDAVEELLKK